MSRRRLLLSGVPVAVVLGVGGWLLLPSTAITEENAAKIKQGMTLVEVEAILGGPGRNEGDSGWRYMMSVPSDHCWESHLAVVHLWLSGDGRVHVVQFSAASPLPPFNMIEAVCRWLRPGRDRPVGIGR
jgi:hypothetical protein